MRLGDLLEVPGLRLVRGDASMRVSDVADDSRRVSPGALFIAREPGFIAAAVDAGAVAVVCGEGTAGGADGDAIPAGVAVLSVERGVSVDQPLCGRIAEAFFGHPSRKLRLIGVTGTSGKTTTAYLIRHLLMRVGVKTGLIGTIVIDDGSPDGPRPAELTTPGAVEMSRLLAAMVASGCRAAVAEVSSHALHQGRVSALQWTCGVLTNLTGDHLDYHGTMDAYADAKAILFELLPESGFAVVNADDAWADRMIRDTRAKVIRTTLDQARGRGGTGDEGTLQPPGGSTGFTCHAQLLAVDPSGTRATFDGPWGSVEVRLPLVGRHNVANTLQAIAAANATSGGLAKVLRGALASLPQVPGRLERVVVDDAAGEPTVLVDYAHKTDALENVLEALRPLLREGGRLVCVFGCGGDRDKTKRPKMAEAACRLADAVVITSDNPRTEDPQAIIADVLAGVPAGGRGDVVVEPDRAAAIAAAVAGATPLDTVLIAGKGHEDYQIIGTTRRHFDDREHAAEALRAWHAARAGTAA
jgi:UDP-N-acetylmuramoyl-L-alanyl-D-glutamate--2,6-diaminopimelate ligase